MSQIRRYVPFLIAGTALIAAACREPMAPPSETPVASLELFEDLSFASLVTSTEGAGAQTINFTFTRAAGSVQLGEFRLQWDANSVCDPLTSGYGYGYFWKPCAAAASDIAMTVKVWEDNGRVYADFSPDIRFSPDKNVTLTVSRPQIIGHRVNKKMVKQYTILYTHRMDDTRYFVDEAWFDPEQRTMFNTTTGDVWREIRHFSGFVIRTGVDDGGESSPEMP
jgi:hypothetical protein